MTATPLRPQSYGPMSFLPPTPHEFLVRHRTKAKIFYFNYKEATIFFTPLGSTGRHQVKQAQTEGASPPSVAERKGRGFRTQESSLQPLLPQTQAPLPAGPRAWAVSPQDKFCGAFWRLVLAQRWMGQLKTVAGSQMQILLEAVDTEIHFVTLCALQVSPELGGQVRGGRCLPRERETEAQLGLTGGFFCRKQLKEGELELQSHWGPCWE